MYDEGGYEPTIEPIQQPNALEEAAQRYWRASRIWRDKEESDWTFGVMIEELRSIQCYRGSVSMRAFHLMDDVVQDRRQPTLELQPHQEVNNVTQNIGQPT